MEMYWENVLIAFRSLKANKVRSFLTVLGTTIGVFAVIMIIAIVTGLKDDIRSQIVSLGADVLDIIPADANQYGPGSEQMFATFKRSEVEEMKDRKDLYRYFSEMYTVSGNFNYKDEEKSGFVVGVTPEYFTMGDRQAIAGELFAKKEEKAAKKTAVLGVKAAEDLFGSPARSIGKEFKINGNDFKIMGVLEAQDIKFGSFDIDDAVYVPATTAYKSLENSRLQEVLLTVPDESRLDYYQLEWEKELKQIRGDDDFTVMAQEDLLDMVDRIMSMITTALGGIASISLLVGGIGIMNIMLVSVTERTREIGIRKAVGAEDKHILTQFLIESITLSILGGVIGLILVFIVSLPLQKFFSISSLVTVPVILGAIGFSVFVGVVFGTAPAYKAAKKDPIEALSYNQ